MTYAYLLYIKEKIFKYLNGVCILTERSLSNTFTSIVVIIICSSLFVTIFLVSLFPVLLLLTSIFIFILLVPHICFCIFSWDLVTVIIVILLLFTTIIRVIYGLLILHLGSSSTIIISLFIVLILIVTILFILAKIVICTLQLRIGVYWLSWGRQIVTLPMVLKFMQPVL